MLHKTVRDVTKNIGNLEYNTAIAFLMEFMNVPDEAEHDTQERHGDFRAAYRAVRAASRGRTLEMLGGKGSVFDSGWPSWDDAKIVAESFDLVAQVNGKNRATMEAPAGIEEKDAIALATGHENVARFIEGKTVVKTIYVPKKLVNIVVK